MRMFGDVSSSVRNASPTPQPVACITYINPDINQRIAHVPCMSVTILMYASVTSQVTCNMERRGPASEPNRGIAGLNPLIAPAHTLPASHMAATEAQLLSLDHPWPHGERATTTRAWPCVVLLDGLRKGGTEAAHGVLVLHAREVVLLLVEVGVFSHLRQSLWGASVCAYGAPQYATTAVLKRPRDQYWSSGEVGDQP